MTATDFTPGVQVATGHGTDTRLGVVERTTATQILVRFYSNREPVRYHKDGLRRVGAGTWDRNAHIRLATEQDRAEIEWRRITHRARELAKDVRGDRRTVAIELREELDNYIARTAPKETDR